MSGDVAAQQQKKKKKIKTSGIQPLPPEKMAFALFVWSFLQQRRDMRAVGRCWMLCEKNRKLINPLSFAIFFFFEYFTRKRRRNEKIRVSKNNRYRGGRLEWGGVA